MFKFLPGLVLLQIITVSLMLLAPDDLSGWGWLRVLTPLVIVALLIAFWFSAIAAGLRHLEIQKLQQTHAREREQLRVNAERAKHKVTTEAHKQIEQEIKRTTAKANIKVGAAIAGVVSLGGFLLLTQFVTLGLLMMTAAGGTLGGYVLRIRQERNKSLPPTEATPTALPKIINPEQKIKAP